MDSCRVKPHEIDRLILLPLEDFRKSSPFSFQLGSKYHWLGAYSADLPPAGSGLVGEEYTPPWRLCGASNWADLYPQLVELDKQGRVTSMIILCPALGEMPEILPDNLSGVEGQTQAIARSVGIKGFPGSIGGIAKFISAKHRFIEGKSIGGSRSTERKGILEAIKLLLQADPSLTCRQAWGQFPSQSWASQTVYTPDGKSFEVYRSGEDLLQEDEEKNKTTSIKFRTFERYFTAAREQVNRNSKTRRDS